MVGCSSEFQWIIHKYGENIKVLICSGFVIFQYQLGVKIIYKYMYNI